MPNELDVQAVVQAAKKRGYFDIGVLKGSYTPEQLRVLFRELDRRKIPRDAPEERMDRGTALTIVNALRTGTVPQCDLSALSVGRAILRRRLVADLHEVAHGAARVRYLNAAYGAGKTHSLWLLAEEALREDFAVSFVTLSPSNCPLHSLLTVYGAIVGGVHTAGARSERGLERLLDRWIEIIQRDGRAAAQQRLQQLPQYVVTALAEYTGATCNPVRQNQERCLLILRYLAGKSCSRRELRQLGITQFIEDGTALASLREITLLIRQLGFRGLCIFLDEAESVLSFSRSQLVDQAYTNLYRIVEAGPQLQNCYFIYAATPTFFDEYTFHWPDRVAIDASDVYALEPLAASEYLELAERICGIYARAYSCSVPTEKVRQLVPQLLAEGHVGSLVRSLVAILDRVRRHA